MSMNNWLKTAFAAAAAMTIFAGTAFGMAGTHIGKLTIEGQNQAPADSKLTYIAFLNGNDDVIHTENAYNSPLGSGNGYVEQAGEGMFLVNFSNFKDAKVGDSFNVVFSTKDGQFRGEMTSNVPGRLTQADTAIALTPATVPAAPAGLKAETIAGGVTVSWNAEAGMTYRVYRADLPSGAQNGKSRGIYEKVAEGLSAGQFVDNGVNAGQDYWYIVLAEDANGTLGVHTDEVTAKGGASAADTSKDIRFSGDTPEAGISDVLPGSNPGTQE